MIPTERAAIPAHLTILLKACYLSKLISFGKYYKVDGSDCNKILNYLITQLFLMKIVRIIKQTLSYSVRSPISTELVKSESGREEIKTRLSKRFKSEDII